jgi:hypothetical protein
LPFGLKRLAVTEEQIDEWNLPTRPTKRSDSRARSFGSSVSVELDAIDPRRLRSLVERAIRKHMPKSASRSGSWWTSSTSRNRTRRDHEDHRRHRQG